VPGSAEAAPDLTRFVFRVDPRRREHIAADFALTTALVDAGLVRRLRLPDSLDSLPAVSSWIAEAVSVVEGALA
jgi:hypothetical protein